MLISYLDIEKNEENICNFEVAKNLHCLLLRNIILNIIEELKEDAIENE